MIIAIHGGAGVIERENISDELEKQYRAGLERALKEGHTVLKSKGSALDSVQAAVMALEDDPLFNAGKGSVFTSEGKCEMDAAIMEGATGRAGAVAGITGVKNPVALARLVMEKTGHVLLTGRGAEEFAKKNNVRFENEEYFFTELRKKQWEQVKNTSGTLLDHSGTGDKKFGTVGAVAIDVNGNLAAATSTGGMTNKTCGRIGDTPLIGAGTFADKTVAVSCTGHGEFFIRQVVAHEVSALMRYKSMSLQQACDEVLFKQLLPAGGEGGLIAIDKDGNYSLAFNTPGMYRGVMDANEKITVSIFAD
jgi:beta-aspartyl-peptidase (threonine type)